MKIPKYIINAIHKRDQAAKMYISADGILNEWLEKNNLEIEYSHGSVETICGYNVVEETIHQIEEAIALSNIDEER